MFFLVLSRQMGNWNFALALNARRIQKQHFQKTSTVPTIFTASRPTSPLESRISQNIYLFASPVLGHLLAGSLVFLLHLVSHLPALADICLVTSRVMSPTKYLVAASIPFCAYHANICHIHSSATITRSVSKHLFNTSSSVAMPIGFVSSASEIPCVILANVQSIASCWGMLAHLYAGSRLPYSARSGRGAADLWCWQRSHGTSGPSGRNPEGHLEGRPDCELLSVLPGFHPDCLRDRQREPSSYDIMCMWNCRSVPLGLKHARQSTPRSEAGICANGGWAGAVFWREQAVQDSPNWN